MTKHPCGLPEIDRMIAREQEVRKEMKVWKLTLGDGGPALISASIAGVFPELKVGEMELSPGEFFKIECVEMPEDEMNALPDFDGF